MFYNKSMNDYRAQIRRPLTNSLNTQDANRLQNRVEGRYNELNANYGYANTFNRGERHEFTQYAPQYGQGMDQVSRTSHLNHLNHLNNWNHVNHLNNMNHVNHLGQTTMWQEQYLGYETPDTDILELDDQYVLEVALPGVCLDDIELKMEDNVLSVIAKRTPAMFEEKAAVLRKELSAGLMVREFEFEAEILSEQIEARLERGILFVSVPKVEVAIRIPVSAGTFDSHMNGMKTRVNKTELHQNRKEVSIK